jgi:hypothetical protein
MEGQFFVRLRRQFLTPKQTPFTGLLLAGIARSTNDQINQLRNGDEKKNSERAAKRSGVDFSRTIGWNQCRADSSASLIRYECNFSHAACLAGCAPFCGGV